jgi:hypothetical protein
MLLGDGLSARRVNIAMGRKVNFLQAALLLWIIPDEKSSLQEHDFYAPWLDEY